MKKQLLIPLILTLLGGLVRFFWLDRFPVAPNWDEISHGYNAYSILLTGKDEWGTRLPLIFRAFGDYKLPLYIYLTVFPVWAFGLSVFSIRFISALAGTLAIPGIYLLTRALFLPFSSLRGTQWLSWIPLAGKSHSTILPLVTSFFLAFMPWHFFISRPALEANLSLTLIIFAAYFLISGLQKPVSYIYASFLFGLSLHTYNTSRIFVPTIILAFIIIYWKQIKQLLSSSRMRGSIPIIFSTIILGFFATIVAYQVFTGTGTARYGKLNIITESTAYTLGQKRLESGLPPIIAKFVYNRPLYFAQTFINNYFGYFAPDFFNQSRGAQFQFAIPGRNLLGFPIMVLFLIGIFYLIKNPSEKSNQFILSWLLLSPVASALTVDPPQALRPNPMIPATVIIAALGLFFLADRLSAFAKTFLIALVMTVAIIVFVIYSDDYFTNYSKTYSESWQYGYRQVFDFINTQKNFTKVFISKRYGEAHIFYAFYNKLTPEKLQPGGDNIRYGKSDWFWTDKIDNVYFVNDWQIPVGKITSLPLESGGEIPTSNSLMVASPDHLPTGANVLKTINFLDGSTAFKIIELP